MGLFSCSSGPAIPATQICPVHPTYFQPCKASHLRTEPFWWVDFKSAGLICHTFETQATHTNDPRQYYKQRLFGRTIMQFRFFSCDGSQSPRFFSRMMCGISRQRYGPRQHPDCILGRVGRRGIQYCAPTLRSRTGGGLCQNIHVGGVG